MPELRPGDLLLVKTDHFVSKLIRFGQRGYGPEYAQYNHVAVYIGREEIVEALTTGVVRNPLSKYPQGSTKPIYLEPYCCDGMRENACHYAECCVGEKYGWLTIAAIALKVATKGKLSFGVRGTSICSGLAARATERLGYIYEPADPAELTPAFLAKEL